MPAKFQLDIVSPESLVFSEEVVMLQAPGSDGELGVLAHHAPLITSLTKGTLKVYAQNDKDAKAFKISDGFLEVANNKCTVLASVEERA